MSIQQIYPQEPLNDPLNAELWLVRHSETEWFRSLCHTGRTDIPLTDRGRYRARALKTYLASQPFKNEHDVR